jgi:hypothetical protein
MRILQFLNIPQNLQRISPVSHIGQRRHYFFMRKTFNFKQTFQQTINSKTYNSLNSKVEFKSLSVSNTSEDNAVISTFDLFSIGIGPSSRFVTVTL